MPQYALCWVLVPNEGCQGLVFRIELVDATTSWMLHFVPIDSLGRARWRVRVWEL